MYGFYLFNRVDAHDYLGNPDLAQETSWNLHLGSVYSRDKITVQGNLFGYFFSDYIAGVQLDGFSHMTIGALGVKQYINLSNALLYGGELVATWKPWEHATFTSATSVSIGLDNEKSPLPFIPPLKSITGFKFHLKGYQFNFNYTFAMAQNLVNTEKCIDTTAAFRIFIRNHPFENQFALSPQNIDTTLYDLNHKIRYHTIEGNAHQIYRRYFFAHFNTIGALYHTNYNDSPATSSNLHPELKMYWKKRLDTYFDYLLSEK